MISCQQIRSTLAEYSFNATDEQCAAITSYTSLLLHWNEGISLTGVSDPLDIVRFHFGESVFAISAGPITKGRLADVGSGAGFPGLALKIGAPQVEVTLLEPNGKKAAFLNEVIREAGLSNARVVRQRFEDFKNTDNPFDFITSRALGRYQRLLDWSERMLSPEGRVFLWIGEAEARELTSGHAWKWDEPRLIPSTDRRFLLSGRPNLK